ARAEKLERRRDGFLARIRARGVDLSVTAVGGIHYGSCTLRFAQQGDVAHILRHEGVDAPYVDEGEGSAAGGTRRLFLCLLLLSNGPKRTRAAPSVVAGQRHRELGRLHPAHHARGS